MTSNSFKLGLIRFREHLPKLQHEPTRRLLRQLSDPESFFSTVKSALAIRLRENDMNKGVLELWL